MFKTSARLLITGLMMALNACQGSDLATSNASASINDSFPHGAASALAQRTAKATTAPPPAPAFAPRSGASVQGYIAYRFLPGIGVLDPVAQNVLGSIGGTRNGGEAIVLSPDQRTAYLASPWKSFVSAVDVSTGEETQRYFLPGDPPPNGWGWSFRGAHFASKKPMVITPDGQFIYLVAHGNNQHLIKINTLTHEVRTFGNFLATNIALSNDGRFLYATRSSFAIYSDAPGAPVVLDLQDDGAYSTSSYLDHDATDLDVSHDGTHLYLKDGQHVYQYDIRDPGHPIFQRAIQIDPVMHSDGGFAISPNDDKLFVFVNRGTSLVTDSIRVFNVQTGALIAQLSPGNSVMKMRFSPDGRYGYALQGVFGFRENSDVMQLSPTGNGRISVIDMQTTQITSTINTPLTPMDLVFSTAGQTPVPLPVLAATPQPQPASTPVSMPPAQAEPLLYAAGYTSDNAGTTGIKVRTIDPLNLSIVEDRFYPLQAQPYDFTQYPIEYSPDGKVFCYFNSCRDRVTGEFTEIYYLPPYSWDHSPPPQGYDGQALGFAFSPFAHNVYFLDQGAADFQRVFNFDRRTHAQAGSMRRSDLDGRYYSLMTASLDGRSLYVATTFNTIEVLNARTLAPENTIYFVPKATCLRMSPDNRYLAVGLDKAIVSGTTEYNIALVNTATLEVEAYLPGTRTVKDIVFSPDSSKIYASNFDPRYVAVIDVATRTRMRSITLSDRPTRLALSLDGSRLFVATQDIGTTPRVKVIDTVRGSLIGQLPFDFMPSVSVQALFMNPYPQTSVCAADFDGSGSVTQEDLFAFLAAYHTSGDVRADFNGDGTVSVQDLFDFLALYHRGCQ